MAAVKTYLFKPKPTDPTKIVVVIAEESKHIGGASALAKTLGFKDMRAAEDAYVQDLFQGKSKTAVTPLDLSSSHAQSCVVALSESLSSIDGNLVFAESTTLPAADLLAHLNKAGLNIKTLPFGDKGAAPPASTPAAPKKEANSSTAGSTSNAAAASTSAELLENPGLTIKKDGDDFGGWYQQVVTKAEMIDYYDISGCYILRPLSFWVWEQIQGFFDGEIKKLGVENTYFPMFVSSRVLEKEKDHVEGFAPEVAWVTRAGQSPLEEPIAIRPTSETVMYPAYAKWIRSYRDLPLKLNQWNSVVRWEFKNPQPFLRTREFLWQEGHTAHLYKDGAAKEVTDILDLYRRVYEDLLAVPVIPGVKSEKEKFAGGLYTTTVEGFIPSSGRGIQGGTSHCLGQNFSKMFGIEVEDPKKPGSGEKLHVWQNSWGLSTRTIGVMVMMHSDDKGLVLPPRVAQWKAVIIPVGITAKTSAEKRQELTDRAAALADELTQAGIKVKADLREGYTPGYKYNDWEMKGVPLRLELGPKDLEKQQVRSVRRDNVNKEGIADLPLNDIVQSVQRTLDTMQSDLYNKAKAAYDAHIKVLTEWKDFVPALNAKNVCAVPWCDVEACEDDIKKTSAEESAVVQDDKAPSAGAKSLCIPFDQDRWGSSVEGKTCIKCGQPAKKWTLFGRSY